MPAYILRRLPPTVDHPGGGAAVCLPTSGRIVARFAATVDSPESLALAEHRARQHARSLRQAETALRLELQAAADTAAERDAWGEGDATPAAEQAWADLQAAFAAAWTEAPAPPAPREAPTDATPLPRPPTPAQAEKAAPASSPSVRDLARTVLDQANRDSRRRGRDYQPTTAAPLLDF